MVWVLPKDYYPYLVKWGEVKGPKNLGSWGIDYLSITFFLMKEIDKIPEIGLVELLLQHLFPRFVNFYIHMLKNGFQYL